MNDSKKYWCFTCNSECSINIIKQDGEEEYQCSKCKNTFIEEITQEDNPSNFHIQQQTQSNNNPSQQPNTTNTFNNLDGINITITSMNPLNNINLSNFNNFNNNIINNINNRNNQNESEPEYELGIDGTYLFLPSTVNYRKPENERNRFMNDFLNGGEIITEVVNPNGQNIIISRNFVNNNSPINNFLLNHINDHQFENFINIITAFDLQHKGNPPASERAINNLKKTEINKNNINDFKEQTCNVCLENFSEGQISIKLDCGHHFHENCIIHWLKMRNTCPVCRHELESNDPNYERRKNNHRENLRNLHRNNNNSNNNNSGGGNSGMFV